MIFTTTTTTTTNVSALEWAIENLDFMEKLGWSEKYKDDIAILIMKYKSKSNCKINFDENNDDIYCLIECCNEEYDKYREEMWCKWEESKHPFNKHPSVSQEQVDAETREFAFCDEVTEICKWVRQELKKNVWR